MARQSGVVKWFNDQKGYGFITAQDGEYFVHQTAIKMDGRRTLVEGQEVEFTATNGDKGKKAVDVSCS
jgi:CspA family cold shock protein